MANQLRNQENLGYVTFNGKLYIVRSITTYEDGSQRSVLMDTETGEVLDMYFEKIRG